MYMHLKVGFFSEIRKCRAMIDMEMSDEDQVDLVCVHFIKKWLCIQTCKINKYKHDKKLQERK